jgi:hypothetical protein
MGSDHGRYGSNRMLSWHVEGAWCRAVRRTTPHPDVKDDWFHHKDYHQRDSQERTSRCCHADFTCVSLLNRFKHRHITHGITCPSMNKRRMRGQSQEHSANSFESWGCNYSSCSRRSQMTSKSVYHVLCHVYPHPQSLPMCAKLRNRKLHPQPHCALYRGMHMPSIIICPFVVQCPSSLTPLSPVRLAATGSCKNFNGSSSPEGTPAQRMP